MQLAGKNILVLGGTGVLGTNISQYLINTGANIYSVASTMESARKVPGSVALRLFADLQSNESINTLAKYLKDNEHIDGILNAAGIVGFGPAETTTYEQAQKLMQINHLGPAHLISALLPKLSEKPSSFVASITGVVAEKTFPGLGAYSASKAAHSSWLQALRNENKNSTLKVFEFRPGHTETGLASRAIFGTAPKFPTGMQPDFVAKKIVEALIEDHQILTSEAF